MLPSHISARLNLLKTRAALPAWILVALAGLGNVEDVVSATKILREWTNRAGLGWLFSPIGLLLFAVAWLMWLLVRPPRILAGLERAERLRKLLREAAVAIREDDVAADAAAERGEIGGTDAFIYAVDFLDDAFLARVGTEYLAFREREERMFKAAGVQFSGLAETAAYFERLADKISAEDVDPGFELPASFASWCKRHQPNTRPVIWKR